MTERRAPAPRALVYSALEVAFNRYLRLDPESVVRLDALEERVLRIEVRGLELEVFLLVENRAVRVHGRHDGTVDATICAAPMVLTELALGRLGVDSFFEGDIAIEGDIETVQGFQALWRETDVDWEEQLSRVVGDAAAHGLGNVARHLSDWAHQVAQTLGRDLSEYLQYERQDVPPRHEVDDFLAAADSLRIDADRLEARIRRLEEITGHRTSNTASAEEEPLPDSRA